MVKVLELVEISQAFIISENLNEEEGSLCHSSTLWDRMTVRGRKYGTVMHTRVSAKRAHKL